MPCIGSIRMPLAIVYASLSRKSLPHAIYQNPDRERRETGYQPPRTNQEMGDEEPDICRKLFAIKWICNAGSHAGELTRDGLLDAMDVLQFTLNEIYDDHKRDLELTVSRVNKKKRSCTLTDATREYSR